ncbi:MAG: glycosyltransferase family 39 protein [Patescibacteria group bacterium]|nr:glycosyltransferase family 39 protein [Patescibacteria group bacterium]
MKKLELFLLIIIVVGAFLVRLYKIDNPIADWHSWRQADTAAVARNFVKDGYNFFWPQVDNYAITNEWGLQNPNRLFLVEAPIYQTIIYIAYNIWGVHEYIARLISVVFSLGSIILIYFIARRFFGKMVGFWAAIFFAFIPYSVYYSRVIMPEPMMIFFSLASILALFLWRDKNKSWLLILSSVFVSLTFLLKPYQVILFLPFLYFFFREFGLSILKKWEFWSFLIISLVPLILWRNYISLHREGIPASTWLFNDGNIRFTGAFFRWIFAERIAKIILGYWGIFFLMLGIILKPGKKEGWFFHLWLLGVIIYFLVIARGNVTHDYYQIPILPVLVIFLAKGITFLIRTVKEISRIVVWPTIAIILFFMFAFSWYEIRGYYWINHPEIVEAGRDVDKLTPKDAQVVAPYSADVAFLYQTNRHGWSIMQKPVADLVTDGATHLVSTNPQETLSTTHVPYKVVKQTPTYIILDLRSK